MNIGTTLFRWESAQVLVAGCFPLGRRANLPLAATCEPDANISLHVSSLHGARPNNRSIDSEQPASDHLLIKLLLTHYLAPNSRHPS